MTQRILIQINFSLDFPKDKADEVVSGLGRAYTLTLRLLGAQEIEVLVQKEPVPYSNLEDEKKEG